MKQLVSAVLAAGLTFSALHTSAVAQNSATTMTKEQKKRMLTTILRKFNTYRYGNISVFSVREEDIAKLNQLIGPAEPMPTGLADSCKNKTDIQALVSDESAFTDKERKNLLNGRGCKEYYNFWNQRTIWEKEQFKRAFIITSRYRDGQNFEVIGLLTQKNSEAGNTLADDIDSPSDIFVVDDLSRQLKVEQLKPEYADLVPTYRNKTVFDYLDAQIRQGALENVTIEAQGIGELYTRFAPKVYGLNKMVSEDDVQKYIRISEGIPHNNYKPHEVIVGTDVISWKMYPSEGHEEKEAKFQARASQLQNEIASMSDVDERKREKQALLTQYTQRIADLRAASAADSLIQPLQSAIDSLNGLDFTKELAKKRKELRELDKKIFAQAYNDSLPEIGAEIRYGLDEINMPSLWSERVAVNALWGTNRLGVILPTSGWSALANSFSPRKLTHAGFGLNGSFDFPFKLIDSSGVFAVSGSYVFSNADSSGHQTFYDKIRTVADFLPRWHFQALYSFATTVDKDYQLRFKVGMSAFGMEAWHYRMTGKDDQGQDVYGFAKAETGNESYFGITGRIEYMATNVSTPYGLAVQYFDESLSGNVWLQIPFGASFDPIKAVRLEGRFFAPITRSARPWENSSVVVPGLRLIFNF